MLMPSCANAGSPSKSQTTERSSAVTHSASRAFSTNQPSPVGRSPLPLSSSFASTSATLPTLLDAVGLAVVCEQVEERPRGERLRAEDARALPLAAGQELQRDHRVERGLRDDGLGAVLAHRP